MKVMNRPGVPVFLASVLGGVAGLLGWGTSAAIVSVGLETTVVAAATGSVGASDAASEGVVFGGHASISGKVIHDPDFRAPPVLEIIIDLSGVKGKGLRTGKVYLVSSQAILHRPLVAFDPIEVGFSFAADGNLLLARPAVASVGVRYNAAQGITATTVTVSPPVSD